MHRTSARNVGLVSVWDEDCRATPRVGSGNSLPSSGCLPDSMLVAGQVNEQFLTNGDKAAGYADGIKYAIERGWLEPLTNNRFRLTETVEIGHRTRAFGRGGSQQIARRTD
jgi:hypothetical protein